MKYKIHILAIAAATIAAASCSDGDQKEIPNDALVQIGKSYLTRTDILRSMPGGLSAADSAKYANAVMRAWIDAQLVSQVAAKEIDMTTIDKMVQDYRNELIMLEYGHQMYDTKGASPIPEDSLRAFYERNKTEFKLTRPMVKGVYLKVADDAKSLPKLRKIYRSQKQEDIDNLDKSELNGALHYDYFRDRWVDWEQIESRIPYEFGASSDAFLRSNKNIDFSQGGFTYLLDITDVLHTGETMPYEAAKPLIEDRLRFRDRLKYEEKLKKNLYENAVNDGKITLFCDFNR